MWLVVSTTFTHGQGKGGGGYARTQILGGAQKTALHPLRWQQTRYRYSSASPLATTQQKGGSGPHPRT